MPSTNENAEIFQRFYQLGADRSIAESDTK